MGYSFSALVTRHLQNTLLEKQQQFSSLPLPLPFVFLYPCWGDIKCLANYNFNCLKFLSVQKRYFSDQDVLKAVKLIFVTFGLAN